MKTTLLSTVAAVALALSFGAASAQEKMPSTGGSSSSGGMERSAPSGGGAAEHGMSSERREGATEHGQSKGMQAQSPTSGKKADERNAQAPGETKSNRMSSDKNASDRATQHTGDNSKAGMNDKTGTNAAGNNATGTNAAGTNAAGTNAQTDTRSKNTVGAAPSSETRLTNEQRTEIRDKVIATGPRVNNVNFALSVGTMVPNTVHVVEVPPVIVRIHPEWRGYRYFVANDRVIIVERDSLRIVAVLDV